MESVYAQTTICRSCSSHIELVKAEEPERTDAFSFFKRIGSMVAREHDIAIRCFGCGATQTVSSSAKSSICPKCAQYIDLRDFKITGSYGRNIETMGSVIVTPKGDLGSAKATCRHAQIQGKLRGNLCCTGIAEFKLKGRVNGAVDADMLIVEKRSDIEFVRPLKVRTAEIRGKVYARITAESVVTITKSGWLEGVVYARSITVERGGVFSGELYIGRQNLEQTELLPEASPDLFAGGESGSFAMG